MKTEIARPNTSALSAFMLYERFRKGFFTFPLDAIHTCSTNASEKDFSPFPLTQYILDPYVPSIKDGVRLLQYNIRYGAERNVDGCAPVSFCVAVLAMMVCLYLEGYAFALCEALLATWLGFRWIRTSARIEWYGEEYARVFWAEFASRYGESQHS